MFSIIIPTYNRFHILPRTIASVLAQTYTDWECIIVDDGSTDETKNLIDLYDDPRIRYVYQENAERSAARNNGIRQAQGEYICFLDSDDEYLPEHLEVLHTFIEKKNRAEALFFTHAEFHQNNSIKKHEFPILKKEHKIEYLLDNPIIPARICIHNNILKKIQFREDIVIVEDQVLWATIAMYFPVYQIKAFTVRYHLHDENSVNQEKNCFTPRLQGLQKFFAQKDAQQYIPTSKGNQMLSDCYFGIARYYLHKNEYWKMRKNLILSIIKKPTHSQTKAKVHMIVFPNKHKLSG
ncbi:MAG: glycosyltransferase family 2 protein [Bacteroidales bacterium]|jgi:glycosyltransferase involved in cell wall biosynthesis|nr:glycosyltransferase family 2 protein [Bacteroidales bacterium]